MLVTFAIALATAVPASAAITVDYEWSIARSGDFLNDQNTPGSQTEVAVGTFADGRALATWSQQGESFSMAE